MSHDPYASLRSRDFRLFLVGSVAATIGNEMQALAVGWDLARRTGQPLSIGLVGLVQALPVMLLAVPAGQLADRFPRKWIVIFAQAAMSICSAGLAVLSAFKGPIWSIYWLLGIVGVANAFSFPARHSLMPELVPESIFPNAVTWRSGAWQTAALLGPALGGFGIYLLGGTVPIYLGDFVCGITVCGLMAAIHLRPKIKDQHAPVTWESLSAGFRFVAHSPLILASITLDMFAVLLGGAVSMLPFFATDVLQIGSRGLGFLRAAPALGALLTAVIIAHRAPIQRSGRALLLAVIGFGVATIVFGLSKNAWLSFFMLGLTGAFDNISVVVRSTLIQVRTPNHMRGRVASVNSVFIGMSNELGSFESGLAANFLGLIPSVVLGGIGTIVVAFSCAAKWPELARLGPIDQLADQESLEDVGEIPMTALEVEGHQ
jgi:MFS family permease